MIDVPGPGEESLCQCCLRYPEGPGFPPKILKDLYDFFKYFCFPPKIYLDANIELDKIADPFLCFFALNSKYL